MKQMNKLFVAVLGVTMLVQVDTSFAAFGGSRASSSGMGVSRSYSRPSTPKSSYSAPASKSYSKPSYSNSSSSNNYSKPNYNSNNYNNGNSGGYNNNQYRQRSAMGDIGVGVASVAGGILAAEAIQGLIRGPSGAYTHPQYPGQTFNAQGVPQPAQGQAMPPQEGAVQQQPVYIVQQQAPTASTGGFFSFLWSALGNILHLALYLGVVGAVLYGGWKAFGFLKRKYKKEKANMLFDVESEFENMDSNAMELFYNFQKNSDNKDWVKRNTKYLNVDACLSEPSEVLQYEHKVLDCTIEQGKLRTSVKYKATVENDRVEKINQIWNFEKDVGVWKLIGIEVV